MLIDAGAALVRLLPPETAHRATLSLLKLGGPFLGTSRKDVSCLAIHALGLNFPNPLGLAAGFDKDAEVPGAMAKFGFGFVECGTVTPRPQAGNPRPRLFRLKEDRAVVNRMGFNNQGMETAARRLERYHRRGNILGINLGANKDSDDRIADYRAGLKRLGLLADYVTINVSSPNTPGLRGLQGRDELQALLSMLTDERAKLARAVPLLLKIAPDLDEQAMDDIVDVAIASGIDGLIVSNTTVARPESLRSPHAGEVGGLSGAPLFEPSTRILKAMRIRVGRKLMLVGAGGVSSGAEAYSKIRSGATLVQLYTALAFQGPGLIARIKRDLIALLARDGYANVSDAIGADIA
ncbi:MAG: quinone-dependent dihydroorotate dehydrogenase [Alphaproteobacteria bacterium]|nr:quinone-dependent dihydroorotate dehydrogenase [Alphaproteobacteria bacterium]